MDCSWILSWWYRMEERVVRQDRMSIGGERAFVNELAGKPADLKDASNRSDIAQSLFRGVCLVVDAPLRSETVQYRRETYW